MNEFFTWGMLGTYAGAVLFTTLLTQLLKGIAFIDKIPTRLFSYIIAVIIMIAAYLFTTEVILLADIVLCLVNAVVVSLASNGTFDAIGGQKTTHTAELLTGTVEVEE